MQPIVAVNIVLLLIYAKGLYRQHITPTQQQCSSQSQGYIFINIVHMESKRGRKLFFDESKRSKDGEVCVSKCVCVCVYVFLYYAIECRIVCNIKMHTQNRTTFTLEKPLPNGATRDSIANGQGKCTTECERISVLFL